MVGWYVHMTIMLHVRTHYQVEGMGDGEIYPASGAVVICVQHRCHVINFGHIFQEWNQV